MNELTLNAERLALWMMWTGAALALLMACAVIAGRLAYAWYERRSRWAEARYGALIDRALAGDGEARRMLVVSPARHRSLVANLLIVPLIRERDAARIAATRDLVRALSIDRLGLRYLRSRWWWRRALALRAFGLLQDRSHTPEIVAALDDDHADVRGAALDALTDLRDPAALSAVVFHFNDASLHRGRRVAALEAYGPQGELLVLERASLDAEHRVNYAKALAICGTPRSRPLLCAWTEDARPDVCAAALQALKHVGLDAQAASKAMQALDSDEVSVRAMAAQALVSWPGADVAARLARHLDDAWTVAVSAARSLKSMGAYGHVELRACAGRTDLAGVLARQMLWEARAT